MSVVVNIKQKSIFKKKLNVDDIIKITNASYGICDESYRLISNEKGNHTLLFDSNNLARGIDLSIENNDIKLILSLPSTSKEIRYFYEMVEKICHQINAKTFIRENSEVNLEDKESFIRWDEETSILTLKDLKSKIAQADYNYFEIFGIINPISLGTKELNEINGNLDTFEKFLHKTQSQDVYYAAPRVYNLNNKLVGIYVIGPEILSVVPNEPYLFNDNTKVDQWYVMLEEGKTIEYNDFINNIKDKKYYDSNHVIINLSKKQISKLLDRFA